MTAEIPPLHVVVKFGKGISDDVQSKGLFEFEKKLREISSGLWIEVFKESRADDSKLRSLMTPEQRAKL